MISELCLDVINSFKALKSHLTTVNEHVCVLDRDLPAWIQPSDKLPALPDTSYRRQACQLLSQIEYLDGQQPREILFGAGIIAASSATLIALEQLNQAKKIFKQSMLKLKAAKISPKHEFLVEHFEDLLMQRDPGIATTLARMGLARVHLKQCYRKIPCYSQRPNKIAWTWANTRSIKKISLQQAAELLNKHYKDEGLERQLKLLQGLDPHEKLAIVQELAPHLRANLVMPAADGGQRIMVKGPVPIFYFAAEKLPLPEFTPPKAKSGKNIERMIRKDVKINPEPFLPAIRAHRSYELIDS